MITWVAIEECVAPHRVSHPEKLDKLTEAIAKGWGSGYPALIGYKTFGRIQLLSGSHRIEAAKRAGLKKIPVEIRNINEVWEAWGDLEKWRLLMTASEVTNESAE